jgi:hypothetical protein
MTVTARAAVVKCSPGVYQLRTVLLSADKRVLRPRHSAGGRPPGAGRRRAHPHLGKVALIQSLPDDASELIRDGMNAYRVPE